MYSLLDTLGFIPLGTCLQRNSTSQCRFRSWISVEYPHFYLPKKPQCSNCMNYYWDIYITHMLLVLTPITLALTPIVNSKKKKIVPLALTPITPQEPCYAAVHFPFSFDFRTFLLIIVNVVCVANSSYLGQLLNVSRQTYFAASPQQCMTAKP